MKSILAIVLIGISLSISMSACTSSSGNSAARVGTSLTEDEKHRLYTAALAASDSPFESETYREVCKKIGIFDAHGQQNGNYMGFVAAHLEWAMKTENEQFKREINTRENAREYVSRHLP
jgi:hypothetical protein